MTIRYTKLRDGSWGIRGPEIYKGMDGAAVTVQRKDGTGRTEVIDRVIWRGDGIGLATICRHTTRCGRQQDSSTPPGCHTCDNGHDPHPGPCCDGHAPGWDCGADCCECD
jgi:hypothetical protein